MAIASIRGIQIAYEVLGKEGSPIALTSGGLYKYDREFMRPLAECLSASHRVLIYDRRNTGHSSIAFEQEQSIVGEYVDDLHELLAFEGMFPAHIGGTSGGYMVSLLYARRYPQDVASLILIWPPSDGKDMYDRFMANFSELADLAETEGMHAVLESSCCGWKALAAKSETSRKQLLSMDPAEFASAMRRGAKLFVPNLHFAGLEENQVCEVHRPSLIIPGSGTLGGHPLHVAQKLSDLLPNSRLVVPAQHFAPEVLQSLEDIKEDEQINLETTVFKEMAYYAPLVLGFADGIDIVGSMQARIL